MISETDGLKSQISKKTMFQREKLTVLKNTEKKRSLLIPDVEEK